MKKRKKPDPTTLNARLTLRLPAALLKRLKIAAIEADSNLQNFVLDELMKVVEKEERK